MRRRPPVLRLAACLLAGGLVVSCSPSGPDPLASFNGASFTIQARGLAFDPVILVMPAGQPLRLVLSNQDAGVPHDLHVFRGDTDYGTSSKVVGPGLTAIELPAMAPGSYQFECTIHPSMIGTIIVATGATPGPSGGPDDSNAPADSSAPSDSNAPGDSSAPGDSFAPADSSAPSDSNAPSGPPTVPSAAPN